MVVMKINLEEIKTKFTETASYYSERYLRGQEDCDFALGDQWEDEVSQIRSKSGRPCLTENRLLTFVNKVVNDIRQTRPSIIVRAVDDNADPETAKIFRGVIRNIESISDAETSYDTSAKNAIMSCQGFVRIITEYVDSKSFEQELKIERVLNPFSVFLDPASDTMDGSDAEFCFIFTDLQKEEFESIYPNAGPVSFDTLSEWSTDKTVRVVEYFYKEYTKKKLVEYEIDTLQGVEVGTVFKEDMPIGAVVIRERNTETVKIKHCILSGEEVLQDGEFLGEDIPIVPVYGFEAWKDGKRQIYSLINQAKDPQRMFNYWKSASTEIFALQPKTPWVGAKGSFADIEKWTSANLINHSFLEYNPVAKNSTIMPPPQRQMPPAISPTMQQEVMSTAEGIQATLGIYDASLGKQTRDISGKAIISRQMQGDNATFHFVDNLATSMKQVGNILIRLIPLVYSGERIMRILGEDGKEILVPINQSVTKTGEDEYVPMQGGQQDAYFDLDAGKYDVTIEIGSSFATKRQEMANAIVELGNANPKIYDVAGDLMVKALDFTGAEEIAERIRATMDPALLGEDLEAQRLQKLGETIQQLEGSLEEAHMALQVKENDQQLKNKLEADKIENDRLKIEVDASKVDAEIRKIDAEIQLEILAEASKDMAEAQAKLGEDMSEVKEVLGLFLDKMEEEAGELKQSEEVTGKPELLAN